MTIRIILTLSSLVLACLPLQGQAPTPDKPADPPATKPAEPVVKLEPMEVLGEPPKLSFGISLQIWQDSQTGNVSTVYLTGVKPDSDAEKQGLKPFTQVTRIDGQPVQSYLASLKTSSALGKIFINRKLGAKVALEVLTADSPEPKTIVLVERSRFEAKFRTVDFR
ncbi:MAG: hypothetical protein KF897_06405 [Opitutaceae bacterium]|nr:hypothetical protein [Opitutaceae bacterium]